MAAKYLIVPDGFEAEIQALLGLTEAQLRALRSLLADRKSLKEGRGYERIGKELAIGNDRALKVLSATNNIRAQRERFTLTDESLIEDLGEFTERAPNGDRKSLSDEQKAALLELLTKSDDDYFVHKVASLRHATSPHLLDARTVVDARPIFAKDRGSVEAYLLVTHLELTTHGGAHEEYERMTCSLSRKDIKTLRDRLDDAEAKLSRLEAALVAGGSEVYD